MGKITWEEAVLWLREQPDQQDLVKACYYDDPLLDASERFSLSEEWLETCKYLPAKHGSALDLGAGRGISSYALAKSGWQVTALEPDPSNIVGAGAIRLLAEESSLPILVVQKWGEKLPFENSSFDLVYGRQVLHHAADLDSFCKEASRVLKPGGRFIATREHVISHPEDLQNFLDGHPLNSLYGGENAFLLDQYILSIKKSGLKLKDVLGCFDSVINYFPLSYENWVITCLDPIKNLFGTRVSSLIPKLPIVGEKIIKVLAHYLSANEQAPGRLYSFICEKPIN